MSSASNSNQDRLHELLADQALHGLDADAARELDTLLREEPATDAETFDRLAATLDSALHGAPDEAMPADVMARLAKTAESFTRNELRHNAAAEPPPVIARISWAPWLVAAASLALAAFVWMSSPTPRPADPPTVAESYERFILEAPSDMLRVPWQAVAKNYPVPEDGFSGEVVWSGAEQQGYMVFEGLPPNDPGVEQFQLWIFDTTRADSPPVDGGVFDVDSSGRVIVPIQAKLPVGEVGAFAVTVEKPGGVVVSSQERIATLAPVEQG